MKLCRRCEVPKELELFPKNSKARDGRGSYCLTCQSDYVRERRYGVTRERYDAMLLEQDNACAVCREPFTNLIKPNVDHDHRCCPGKETCGKCVRGILCSGCNAFAGLIETRSSHHNAMFTYLHLHLERKINRLDETEPVSQG